MAPAAPEDGDSMDGQGQRSTRHAHTRTTMGQRWLLNTWHTRHTPSQALLMLWQGVVAWLPMHSAVVARAGTTGMAAATLHQRWRTTVETKQCREVHGCYQACLVMMRTEVEQHGAWEGQRGDREAGESHAGRQR